LLFKHVDGLRNSVGRIADGVDVRAEGGFIIWWPRQKLRVLSDAEIAEWPAWLLALARGDVPAAPWVGGDGGMGAWGERTLNLLARCKSIQRKVELAQPGERNRLLNWAAYKFGGMIAEGVIKPEVAALLLESSAKICALWRDDGPAQCKATIKSGVAAGIRDA